MLFRKVQKVNKTGTNEFKLKSAEFSRFDLRGVARDYSHDSLLRVWSNHGGKN